MVSKDFLKDRAEKAAESLTSGLDVESGGDGAAKVEDDREFEAPESDAEALNRDEVEFFFNNRHRMGNREMKEFLKGDTEFEKSIFERFSEAEEEVVMRKFPMQDVETIAENLERPEEEVRKKIKMLGLGNRLE